MDEGVGIGPWDRRAWMGLCARAPCGRLTALLDALGPRPAFAWLRAPEIGSVMVRGRAGATGAPFNLGEMTATRGALRLDCGTVGHGWVQGRDRGACEAAALVDALMQGGRAEEVGAAVLAPLTREAGEREGARAAKAAATRVEFFTLVRGEDQ